MKVYKIVNLLPNFLKKARPSGANSLSSYTPSSTSLRILLFCRFQMPGHPTGGGVARLHHAVVDGVGEDKRAGAPPLESKSRCKGELRLPGLVVGHLRARAVAKENSDPGLVVGHLLLLLCCSEFYSPSPLTGLIVMFVPCLNSSLEFILVTGLRFEILTPSFAFLLCGLKNTPVIAILKCSKVVISILPPCLSRMCFHKGLSAVFLWTSAM